MKAIVQGKFGSPREVLMLAEIDKPAAVDDEVLVKVHAASIHIGDYYTIGGSGRVIPERVVSVCDVFARGVQRPIRQFLELALPRWTASRYSRIIGGGVSLFRH